jgi:adenylate cyclase
LKFTEETKIGFRKILWLILFWIVYLQLVNLSVHVYLLHFGSHEYIRSIIPEYNYLAESLVAFVFSIIGASIMGLVEVFYFKRFAKRSFLWNLIIKGFAYTFFLFVMNLAGTFTYNSVTLELPFYHSEVVSSAWEYLTSGGILFNLMVVSMGILIAIFLVQIDMKLGQSGLFNLVSAKYFHPREEARFFMFIDIKSATKIAEQLGHVRYFELLNEFFADATPPILNSKGIIYQYIGDELSVSWLTGKSQQDSKCLQCFFEIERVISEKASTYMHKYGLVPEFKGGIHFGSVSTGEIGLIKKEIIHSGDVLNTASRIQNLCNQYNARLIISKPALEKLVNINEFHFESIGNIALKGKSQSLELLKVDMI